MQAKWDEMFGEKKDEVVATAKVKKPRKKAAEKKIATKQTAVKKSTSKTKAKSTKKNEDLD